MTPTRSTLTDPAPTKTAPPNRAQRRRKLQTFAPTSSVGRWVTAQRGEGPIDRIMLIRTSDNSKVEFDAAMTLALQSHAGEADCDYVYDEVGHEVVLNTAAGTAMRQRLGAFTVTRGNVPYGSGRATIGFAFVVRPEPGAPGTLFLLVLQTAKQGDLPGPTPDQDRNAFTELMCETLRCAGARELHTPIWNRLVRKVAHGVRAIEALKVVGTQLVVNHQHMPLDTSADELMAVLLSGFSDKEASDMNSRLGGVQASTLLAGGWPWGMQSIPFTHQAHPTEKYRVVPVPDQGSVLVAFLTAYADGRPDREVAKVLGAAGITSRAPRSLGVVVTDLKRPEWAVRSLVQDRWLDLWSTGTYRTTFAVVPGVRALLPQANWADGEDDRLLVELDWDMPEGGWGIDDKLLERVRARRDAKGQRRRGRGASTKTDLRPLLGVCAYDDGDRAYRLLGVNPNSYQLVSRPVVECTDAAGMPTGWYFNDCDNDATFSSKELHTVLGQAIATAAITVGDRLAPLSLPEASPTPETSAETRRAKLDADIAKLTTRIDGLRLELADARGEGDRDEVDALKAAMRHTKTDRDALIATRAHVETAPAALEQAAGDATADFHRVALVAAALQRYDYRAPAALNRATLQVVRDLHFEPVEDCMAYRAVGTLALPLTDGSIASVEFVTDPIPNRAIGTRVAQPIATARSGASGGDVVRYAEQYFLRGKTFADLGELRRIDGSGSGQSFLWKRTRRHLIDDLAASTALTPAIIDAPAPVRRDIYRALIATEITRRDDPWLAHLHRTYTDTTTSWATTWVDGDHSVARRAADVLAVTGPTTVATLAAAINAAPEAIAAAAYGPRHGRRPGLLTLHGPRRSATGTKTVAPTPCAHRSCNGTLVPLYVPEVPGGGLCAICRRSPADATMVFPDPYLRRWTARRRQPNAHGYYVGSHDLDEGPDATGAS